jgi:hypothetical protein
MNINNSAQPEDLPQILLPGLGRPEGVFAAELGRLIGPTDKLVIHNDELFEVTDSSLPVAMSPVRFKTWIEQYAVIGIRREGQFLPKTMSGAVARSICISSQFRAHLPKMLKVDYDPTPVTLPNGSVVRPQRGFNRASGIYSWPIGPSFPGE